MEPVTGLCIVYDEACGLCTNVKDWLGRQPALVPMSFIASRSDAARKKFPRLTAGELAVIGNTGEVWTSNGAWIVCLWALRDYREWSIRFSNPLLLAVAREAFAGVSSHRAGISDLLSLQSEREIEQRLRSVIVPACLPDRT
jgi:predicted DCC family thiol-disulfide oxidoreductase YuxK